MRVACVGVGVELAGAPAGKLVVGQECLRPWRDGVARTLSAELGSWVAPWACRLLPEERGIYLLC